MISDIIAGPVRMLTRLQTERNALMIEASELHGACTSRAMNELRTQLDEQIDAQSHELQILKVGRDVYAL